MVHFRDFADVEQRTLSPLLENEPAGGNTPQPRRISALPPRTYHSCPGRFIGIELSGRFRSPQAAPAPLRCTTRARVAYTNTAAAPTSTASESEIQNDASGPVTQISGFGVGDTCHSARPRVNSSQALRTFPPACRTTVGRMEFVRCARAA